LKPKTEKVSRCTVYLQPAYHRNPADLAEPSSAEVLGYVADMSRADFIRAIEIADKGYRKYSTTTTFYERGVQLRKWFDLVHANIDDCMKLL
jgi:succinate-semialdehyde dehydrogenase/glutarate-semialdehyde dehydrogenase